SCFCLTPSAPTRLSGGSKRVVRVAIRFSGRHRERAEHLTLVACAGNRAQICPPAVHNAKFSLLTLDKPVVTPSWVCRRKSGRIQDDFNPFLARAASVGPRSIIWDGQTHGLPLLQKHQ